MSRSGHIWRELAFKTFFLVIGVILFTGQVSYKFYYSASMPVFRSSVARHAGTGDISNTDGDITLSLDKRFDLKFSFVLLTPAFRILHYAGSAKFISCLVVPGPVDNKPALSTSRGPPPATRLS